MGMSPSDIDALRNRVREKAGQRALIVNAGNPGIRAKGRIEPRDRGMNKTEKAYAAHLEQEKLAGRVAFYEFEAIKLRLSDDCLYIPDFLVLDRDGYIELHDSKAWWASSQKVGVTDDGLVKMKMVAEKFPMFRMIMTWERDGLWQQRIF